MDQREAGAKEVAAAAAVLEVVETATGVAALADEALAMAEAVVAVVMEVAVTEAEAVVVAMVATGAAEGPLSAAWPAAVGSLPECSPWAPQGQQQSKPEG